jgi:hypothetical protein
MHYCQPLIQKDASHKHRYNKAAAPEYNMHGHGNEVGKSLVIEDREQTKKDHLDDVGRERDLSRFEFGYWNTSPPDYDEVFGKSIDSNGQELEESDEVTDVRMFRGQLF